MLTFSGTSLGSLEDYSKKSKLCRNLDEIVRDHEAVPYLIQYLESCKAAALLRFWLDAESFQASTWTRIRTHSLHTVSKSSLVKENDKSTESLTKSFNKDITSPVSVSSLESMGPEYRSKSLEALSSTVGDSQQSRKPSDDTEVETSQESVSDLENQSNTQSSRGLQNSPHDNTQSVIESCDSRVREKCKIELERNSLSLPLSETNCDPSSDSAENECAISYRDITTPSPTDSSAADTNTKSGATGQSKAATANSLAEKLKKSIAVIWI